MTEDARQSVLDNADVRFSHYRRLEGSRSNVTLFTTYEIKSCGLRAAAKGGKTVASIVLPDGRAFFGEAICSPRDNFCRKTGRQVALGRALKAALA